MEFFVSRMDPQTYSCVLQIVYGLYIRDCEVIIIRVSTLVHGRILIAVRVPTIISAAAVQ